jgi:phosphoglucosamine mutase
MRLFGTSGIRRLFDSNLVYLALKVGLALGKIHGNVVVGGDTRTSSPVLKHTLISGLLAAGARCEDVGMVPTPTLAFATRKFDAGAMITASHNPPEYNGIKLLNPDGSSFGPEQQKQMEEMILTGSLDAVLWDKIKESDVYHDAVEQHIERIVQDFPIGLKLKVVLDCGCGAASVITPYLLKKLGCEVVEINCYPSGFFPRGIEPTESNLEGLIKATGESGADLGIAHDGDADRMMAVDERGRFIPGDKLMAIFARALKAKEMVTTLDASMAIEEMGFRVRRTRIGDTCVSEELKNGGDFGGEPSGSWVFPGVSLCPDGIYAAAKVVEIAEQHKLSSLVDAIPAYPILRGSLSSERIAMSSLESQLMRLEPLSVTDTDGFKLSFEDGWLLARASGTEPKIRLTAEAKSEARAHQLYESGLQAIKNSSQRSKEKTG